MDLSELSDFNVLCDGNLETVNQGLRRSHNGAVVDVNKDDDKVLSLSSKEHCLVHLTSCKFQVSDHYLY